MKFIWSFLIKKPTTLICIFATDLGKRNTIKPAVKKISDLIAQMISMLPLYHKKNAKKGNLLKLKSFCRARILRLNGGCADEAQKVLIP